MATTFLAIDPAGATHKRTSQNRTYAATVVVRKGVEQAQRDFDHGETWRRKHDAENYVYAAAHDTVEKAHARLAAKFPALAADPEYVARDAAKNAAFIAGCPTAADYVAKQAAARLAKFEAAKAAGEFERWLNAGWCGRPDLALKLAAQQKGYAEVRILNVEVK